MGKPFLPQKVHWHGSDSVLGKPYPMKTLLELHRNGVIQYLVKSSVVSTSMLSYLQYYEDFTGLRTAGLSYRTAIQQLAAKHQVSATTIKKGVRLVTAAERPSANPVLRMAS